MTKKDYERIARAFVAARDEERLRQESQTSALDGIDTVMHAITRELLAENLRFDARRFHEACRG